MSNSASPPSSHKSNLLFKTFKWPFDFEFLDDSWRGKFDMTMIALNATSCKDESCIQKLTTQQVLNIVSTLTHAQTTP